MLATRVPPPAAATEAELGADEQDAIDAAEERVAAACRAASKAQEATVVKRSVRRDLQLRGKVSSARLPDCCQLSVSSELRGEHTHSVIMLVSGKLGHRPKTAGFCCSFPSAVSSSCCCQDPNQITLCNFRQRKFIFVGGMSGCQPTSCSPLPSVTIDPSQNIYRAGGRVCSGKRAVYVRRLEGSLRSVQQKCDVS